MDFADPDVVARAYVMQWMHENGLHNALRALEKEVGRLYDDSQLPEASQLMQLVWRHVEERLLAQEEGPEAGPGEQGGTAAGVSSSGGVTGGVGGGGSAGSKSRRQQQHEEALRLLRAGDDDYASRVVVGDVPPEVHRSNVIAVRLVPEQDCVITAAGDGCVRCVRYGSLGSGGGGGEEAEVVWQTRVGSAALLSLALHPEYSRGLPLVAVGSMDGRLTVLHGPSGAILASLQPHSKYVVRVAWAPQGQKQPPSPGPEPTQPSAAAAEEDAGGPPGPSGGQQQQQPSTLLLATASTDETVAIVRLEILKEGVDPAAGGGDGIGGVDGGGDGAGGGVAWWSGGLAALAEAAAAGTGTGRLTTVRQIPYGAAVTDVAFLSPNRGASAPSVTAAAAATDEGGRAVALSLMLAVAVRGSNYLRILDVGQVVRQAAATSSPGPGTGTAAAVGGGAVPELLVNLNESGDDHVSFSAKHLAASPCGSYLLVCTDTPRLLVLRTADWTHLRALFGLPVDQFPQPAAAWHRDSNYIYACGAHAQLCVFHLGSGRLVHSSAPHKVNVRDVDYDPQRNLLATCSFDKTVKLLAPGAAMAGKAGAKAAEDGLAAQVAVGS